MLNGYEEIKNAYLDAKEEYKDGLRGLRPYISTDEDAQVAGNQLAGVIRTINNANYDRLVNNPEYARARLLVITYLHSHSIRGFNIENLNGSNWTQYLRKQDRNGIKEIIQMMEQPTDTYPRGWIRSFLTDDTGELVVKAFHSDKDYRNFPKITPDVIRNELRARSNPNNPILIDLHEAEAIFALLTAITIVETENACGDNPCQCLNGGKIYEMPRSEDKAHNGMNGTLTSAYTSFQFVGRTANYVNDYQKKYSGSSLSLSSCEDAAILASLLIYVEFRSKRPEIFN